MGMGRGVESGRRMGMGTLRKIVLFFASTLGSYFLVKLHKFLKWRKEMMQRFPGPPASLLLGNLGDLHRAGGFNDKFFDMLHDNYGPYARFFIGPGGLNVSVVDPELQAEVYRKCSSRPLETKLFLSYLGDDNLLFLHGKIAKETRLAYGMMITDRSQLEKVHMLTRNKFSHVIKHWKKRPVNVFKELGPILYDIMGQALFDIPWSETEIGPQIYELHKYLIQNSNRWVAYPIPPWWNASYRQFAKTIQEWRGLCDQLLEERRAAIAADPARYANDVSALTLLLTHKDENGNPFFSRHRAISSLCGFLNGAYDTTHATTFWLLFNLAKNQGSQQTLLMEIDANIGFEPPTIEALRDMPFLDAVIKESMRIRATVPVNQRVNLDEDVEIGDKVIPKGCNINIPMYKTFQREEYFGPHTDKFIPERFLGDSPQAVKARKSQMAFGHHSRICVGQTFALVELKCILCTILQEYTVHLVDLQQKGTYMIEAGVFQPDVHFSFSFHPRTRRHTSTPVKTYPGNR